MSDLRAGGGDLRRVALVSMHTSPLSRAGTGDAGGMNVTLLAIADQLAARGVEVDLITRGGGPLEGVPLGAGVTLRGVGGGAGAAKAQLADAADAFGESVAVLARSSGPRYDIIHAHYWLSGLATLPVAIELGLPFVQSFHTLGAMKNRSLGPGQEPEPERRLRSETFLARQADAVIASSSAEAAALIDHVGAPADRVWVIPPGVDTRLFTPERRAHAAAVRDLVGVEAGRPLLVLAARLQPLKGVDLAIRALAELHALRGWAPVLVVAGEPTPDALGYRDALVELAAELGVAREVRFVGALDRMRLADLFAAASVVLVPSSSETFGLVALEAAASGTPVVASRVTGLVESVADGVSGVLVDGRDPADWAAATARLVEGADAMRATARSHAERFTWGATAASLLGVYASLRA